tara:strand:+ start:133 stop:762 length:630 start_codon:yes stop_codon:yes gene_type:complete
MYILSIDVGIKNLAHCLIDVIDNSYNIIAWDSIDLSKDFMIYCNNENCNNIAKVSSNNSNFCQKHSKTLTEFKEIRQIKVSDISLPNIGLKLKENYDYIFEKYKIDIVIIENQLSPLASRMKTIQGMITQYFIDNNVVKIEYISAINKLKEYSEKKITYNDRKKLSIAIVKDKLINNNWLEHFIKSKKKDDLADTLLQALFYIKLMRIT